MKKQVIKTTVYDNKTGEVLDTVEFEKDVKEQEKFIVYKKHHSFAKTFSYMIPEYSTNMYLGYFFRLIHRLEKYTNAIINKKGDIISIATRDNIIEYLNISEGTFKKFIAESRKIGAISSSRVSSVVGYFINPAYAYNGQGISEALFRMFERDANFISSLTRESIADFKAKTGNDFMEVIKNNFPTIYELKFK